MIFEYSSTKQKTAVYRKNRIIMDKRTQDSPVETAASLPSSFTSMKAFCTNLVIIKGERSVMPEKLAFSLNISPRPNYENNFFSLHMHAKPSFAHRLLTEKMTYCSTKVQNNGPTARNVLNRAQSVLLKRKMLQPRSP